MFDIVVLAVVFIFAFIGFRRGLVDEVVKLVGLTLAIICGIKYFYVGVALIEDLFAASEGVYTVIGFILVFLIVYFAFQLVGSIIKRIVKSLKLIWLDRSTGFCFGALKGTIILAFILWIISLFPEIGIEDKIKCSSGTYKLLYGVEVRAISTFHLEDELDSLRLGIRNLFLLENNEETIL